MEDNQLRDRAVTELLRAATGHSSLAALNLSNNAVQDAGAAELGRFLGACSPALKELGLAWCNVRKGGAVAVARGLKANTSLQARACARGWCWSHTCRMLAQTLDISWNAFGSLTGSREAARALADALSAHVSLTHMDVGHNGLDAGDAKLLASALVTNHTLQARARVRMAI